MKKLLLGGGAVAVMVQQFVVEFRKMLRDWLVSSDSSEGKTTSVGRLSRDSRPMQLERKRWAVGEGEVGRDAKRAPVIYINLCIT